VVTRDRLIGARRILESTLPLAVAVAAIVLARQTLMPGLGFWDTGEFQAVAPVLGTLHPTGFPVYVLLGWLANVLLAPFGEPAFRLNLFAAICVSLAVGLTAVLLRQMTGRVWLGAATALALFLSPITWAISARADAHSLHLALLVLVLVLLVGWEARERAEDGRRNGSDRWLVAAAAAYGLAIGNH
jgi:hypothetical protein